MIATIRAKLSSILHLVLIILGGLSLPLYFVERHEHEKNLEKFGEALAAADAGRWYWNLETNELIWDDQMFVLFGRVKEHWSPSYGGFEETLHPEDKARVSAQVSRAIEQRGGYQDVFRIITPTGEVRETRSSAMESRNGKYMTGINLPAINRPGNFIRTKVTPSPPIPIPGIGLQEAKQLPGYVESTRMIQN
jgi:PAS domain-containing protein